MYEKQKKRVVLILQARMGASRLPGKPLKNVLGRSLLSYQLERLRLTAYPDEIVVATTTEEEDSQIESLCQAEKTPFYRGSQTDVLDRYYQAAKLFKADVIVRITGDCPLIDPVVVDQVIKEYLDHFPQLDYVSNSLKRTYPRGLDVEVFSFSLLEKAAKEAKLPDEREHVTLFFYTHPELFSLGNVRQAIDRSFHRWTVDTSEDLDLITRILEELYPQNPSFTTEDILRAFEQHPDWIEINAHIKQKILPSQGTKKAVKYSNLASFEKHLVSAGPNHFSDVYLILGKEAFVRKQATDRLIAQVLKEEISPELSIQVFDAEKHGVDLVLQELETLGFFSKKRVIIVHNADSLDKASTLKLEAYCSTSNRAVCLVVIAAALNRATTFYKKLEKVGIVLDIAEEKPWEREKTIADWLHGEALKQGKQMGPQASMMLIKQLGTDQQLLSTELSKLICYVGERKAIGETDIAAISTAANLENGWQLGEAIFRRDATAALRISKGLLIDGVALIALLRQIRSQFQTEFQICSILVQGGTPADISQEFPYMKGRILESHITQSQTYGMQRFKQGLLAIDDTEIQAKNSAIDAEFLAERLIIKLTL